MFNTLDISSSALQAQRIRLDSIAQNIAQMNTTHNERGENVPYKRRFPVFMPGHPNNPGRPGVRVKIKEDPSFRMQGETKFPAIDLAVEYVNALEASRAYEANVTTMEVTKAMINASLRLLA